MTGRNTQIDGDAQAWSTQPDLPEVSDGGTSARAGHVEVTDMSARWRRDAQSEALLRAVQVPRPSR